MAERLKRIGTGTILLPNRPGIAQTAAIVGKKEGEGPLHPPRVFPRFQFHRLRLPG